MASSNFDRRDGGGKKRPGPGRDKKHSSESKFKKRSDRSDAGREPKKFTSPEGGDKFERSRGPKKGFSSGRDKEFDPKKRSERSSSSRYSDKKEDSRGPRRSFSDRDREGSDSSRDAGKYSGPRRPDRSEDSRGPKRSFPRRDSEGSEDARGKRKSGRFNKEERSERPYPSRRSGAPRGKTKEEGVRLNKYLSNAGIASRREADKLISAGLVSINGKVITELGSKVMPGDQVTYGGERIKKEPLQYVLLNKPKDFITTAKDPQNRRTVLELVASACKERIMPVGRLDRNTTGVLLFTNDGEMAKRLTHPRYETRKIYQVTLDKPLSSEDMQKIREGLKLEEGIAKVDEVSYLPNEPKTVVGLEIHIGWNRVVRRIFESLGYKVLRLDRTYFAGLTKKNLKRGQWRFLTQEEINRLKMIS